jgi:hypothetical protein
MGSSPDGAVLDTGFMTASLGGRTSPEGDSLAHAAASTIQAAEKSRATIGDYLQMKLELVHAHKGHLDVATRHVATQRRNRDDSWPSFSDADVHPRERRNR